LPAHSEPSVSRQTYIQLTVACHRPNICSINKFIYVCCILPKISRVLVHNRQTLQYDIFPADAGVRRGLDRPCYIGKRKGEIRDESDSQLWRGSTYSEGRSSPRSRIFEGCGRGCVGGGGEDGTVVPCDSGIGVDSTAGIASCDTVEAPLVSVAGVGGGRNRSFCGRQQGTPYPPSSTLRTRPLHDLKASSHATSVMCPKSWAVNAPRHIGSLL
jgi:hypothetical protein